MVYTTLMPTLNIETKKETKLQQQTNTEKRKVVMIATPMYGGMCTAQYLGGVLDTLQVLAANNISVAVSNITNESLITRARNAMVKAFLSTDYDYLMFIDADIGFTGRDVLTLLDADRDVACGIYPKKEINWKVVRRGVEEGAESLSDYAGAFVINLDPAMPTVTTDEKGMIPVRHAGTGFMLIKREVFEKLADKVPEYINHNVKDANGNVIESATGRIREYFTTKIDKDGILLSEDYFFCDLWRENGGTVWANPFIKLTHVGTHNYTGDIVKSEADKPRASPEPTVVAPVEITEQVKIGEQA